MGALCATGWVVRARGAAFFLGGGFGQGEVVGSAQCATYSNALRLDKPKKTIELGHGLNRTFQDGLL